MSFFSPSEQFVAVSEWGGEDFDGGLVALLSFRKTAGSSFNRNHEESEES